MENKNEKKDGFPFMLKIKSAYFQKLQDFFPERTYNLDSLTVGTTEDPTVSRMTIATVSDDETFEQIKKTAEPNGRSDQSD